MRVLLSAYACEPGKGSEPGVGWRWAIEIARCGHDVTVLTRANNRTNIEAGIVADSDYPNNIEFAYYDLPAWVMKLKRRFHAVHLYYALWQWLAFYKARQLHALTPFELVHHITFVSIRNFGRLGKIGIPFVLGPLAGGETSPFWLRWHTGWRGGLRDTFRDLVNALSRLDIFLRMALNKAERVAVTSPQTLEYIPRRHRAKTRCVLQIGMDKSTDQDTGGVGWHKRILYIGRFLYWKGMSIGIDVFAKSLKNDSELTLTLVGNGPEETRWRRLAEEYGIAEKIHWIPWLSQTEQEKIYATHGVLLFPSLHDSGGQVVLEALSHGLPVVCLKLGGPGVIINDNCGRAIKTGHGNYTRLVNDMAQALSDFTETPECWREASIRAEEVTGKWSWAGRVEALGIY